MLQQRESDSATDPVRVWDAPTRLFHWTLVLLLGFSWLSAQQGWTDRHILSGEAILALLVFRLLWGFIGSRTARFATFVGSPLAGLRHLARLGRREPDTAIGHNPAGGWMVLLMLLLIAAQVGTGLFANDDAGTFAPLAGLLDRRTSNRLTDWHAWLFNWVLAAAALHIAAIAVYAIVERQNLLRPMITGIKRLPAGTPPPRLASPLLAVLAGAVAAAAVYALVHCLA